MSFVQATVTIIFAATTATATIAGPSLIASVEASKAAENLGDMISIQQVSQANDGLYAPSLDSMVNGEFGLTFTPRPGMEFAYATNEARTHYISATTIPSGEFLVNSDEQPVAVACEELNAECLEQVTTDAALISAVPLWVSF